MTSSTPEMARGLVGLSKEGRTKVLVAAAASLAASIAVGIAPKLAFASGGKQNNLYQIDQIYPNADQVQKGYYQEGYNTTAPGYDNKKKSNSRSVLWYRMLGGGKFLQINSDPAAPNQPCHDDLLQWTGGPTSGTLNYLSTYEGCDTAHTSEMDFGPTGIVFMPRSWNGQDWAYSSSSPTVRKENGRQVCEGTNTYTSQILGEMTLLNGDVVLHTQTNENQTLTAISGAPKSAACPAGTTNTFKWQENFYLSKNLEIVDSLGVVIGSAAGLERSMGGNLATFGSPANWDAYFSWMAYPPGYPIPPPTVASPLN